MIMHWLPTFRNRINPPTARQVLSSYFKCLGGLLLILFVCEYFVFWFIVIRCRFNFVTSNNASRKYVPMPPSNQQPYRVLMISDVHLLGSRHGFWLDRVKREWQMHITFQLAVTHYQPDAVFILGDLFDEGQIASHEEFLATVQRFNNHFKLPANVNRIVVTGNHDVGFHERMVFYEPYLRRRFEQAMKAAFVKLYKIQGINFVVINSMAMTDDCQLCARALNEIANISKQIKLQCLDQNSSLICPTQRPIVLTHFPMYRNNDLHCNEPDSSSDNQAVIIPSVDCLTRTSTDFLFEQLQPMVVFSGHTHYGCFTEHSIVIENNFESQKKLNRSKEFVPTNKTHVLTIHEQTLASFNWRNRPNPSFTYVEFKGNSYEIQRCVLPKENWIIGLYVTLIIFLLLLLDCFNFRLNTLRLRMNRNQ